MFVEVVRLAAELEIVQGKASKLVHQMNVLIRMMEGDYVRVVWDYGGRRTTQVGFVRVMSEVSFFLEVSTGALLLVENVESLEILRSVREEMQGG